MSEVLSGVTSAPKTPAVIGMDSAGNAILPIQSIYGTMAGLAGNSSMTTYTFAGTNTIYYPNVTLNPNVTTMIDSWTTNAMPEGTLSSNDGIDVNVEQEDLVCDKGDYIALSNEKDFLTIINNNISLTIKNGEPLFVLSLCGPFALLETLDKKAFQININDIEYVKLTDEYVALYKERISRPREEQKDQKQNTRYHNLELDDEPCQKTKKSNT